MRPGQALEAQPWSQEGLAAGGGPLAVAGLRPSYLGQCCYPARPGACRGGGCHQEPIFVHC